MKFFVVTDLEGVAGIDSFSRTRTINERQKGPAMDQLGREVNACIEGIRSVHPRATIDVWDGHGSGGLRKEDVIDGQYLSDGTPYYELDGYDAVLFVGQHAMAGTAFAPLAHTYFSRNNAYYRLNGHFIGEFGARALVAGHQGVPTIYLSGDDKAAHEAEMFVPQIETTVVKYGRGLESAKHVGTTDACEMIAEGVQRASGQIEQISPFDRVEPPYVLEIRFYEPINDETVQNQWEDIVTRIDERTIRLETENLKRLPF